MGGEGDEDLAMHVFLGHVLRTIHTRSRFGDSARIKKEPVLDLAEELMRAGKDFDLALAPAGTHGWAGPPHYARYLYGKLLGHFARYLAPEAAGASGDGSAPSGRRRSQSR